MKDPVIRGHPLHAVLSGGHVSGLSVGPLHGSPDPSGAPPPAPPLAGQSLP